MPVVVGNGRREESFMGNAKRILTARCSVGLMWIAGLGGCASRTEPIEVVASAALDRQDSVAINPEDVTWITTDGTVLHPDSNTPTDAPLHNSGGGQLVGATWGQWEAATATSTMRCRPDGSTEVKVQLGSLEPNATYSVFYRTFGPDSFNPFCSNEERVLVLAQACKGGHCSPQLDSDITTDAAGSASYAGVVTGKCLLDATQVFLEVVFHLDGLTYGQLPNRLEFQTQLRPCATDGDCQSGDVCLTTGLGLACQPASCSSDPTTCRSCSSSFGADAFRQVEITQKGF
jgi:hypothetical protein